MSKDYTEIYFNDTFKLASTLCIKSSVSADLINTALIATYGSSEVDEDDPSTWKYYLNISGEYHTRDTMMQVVSLDTMSKINFTKNNLIYHTATAEAYQFGSRYYKTLVANYPDQEQLICGILYPADITEAIDAEDGTILAYPTELVEDHEVTLIQDLEDWIKRYLVRWTVNAFITTHELFAAAQHAILYLNLVPKILNLRLARCKTEEAHTYHIRNYLASHGKLDVHLDYMTLKQKLWLYRNIVYIEHNSGNRHVFDWMVEKLLTDRHIPIAEYSMRHLDSFTSEYKPEFIFRRKALNPQYNTTEKSYIDLSELKEKEVDKAIGNELYYSSNEDDIEKQFQYSLSSVVQTKDLESSMVDYVSTVPFTLSEVLINHWGYMSANSYYNVIVSYKHPVSGETKYLFSDEAFIYLYYVCSKALGYTLETIPTFEAMCVVKTPMVTAEDLLKVVDSSFNDASSVAAIILSEQPRITKCLSKTAFFEKCSDIYDHRLRNWYRISRTEHMYRRAMMKQMCFTPFKDTTFSFTSTGKSYSTWLSELDITDEDFTTDQYLSLISSIFHNATGYDENPSNILSNVQKSMLSILEQLSSYSIQILKENITSRIYPVGWSAIRIGDLNAKVSNDNVLDPTIDILDYGGSSKTIISFDTNEVGLIDVPAFSMSHSETIETGIITSVEKKVVNTYDYELGSSILGIEYIGKDSSLVARHGLIGIEKIVGITRSEMSQLVDLYNETQDTYTPFNKVGLGDIILDTTIESDKLLTLDTNTLNEE